MIAQVRAAVDRVLAAEASSGENKTTMPAGYITLGQISARLSVLEVSCNRCDRRSGLNAARLIAGHGRQFPVPELRYVIAANSPRMIAGHLHDVCGIHFQGLSS